MDRIIASVEQYAPFVIGWLLILTVFVLPISSTGKSYLLVMALLAIVLTPSYCKQVCAMVYRTWAWAALLLFILVLLACFWSPAPFVDRIYALEKYSKLLFLSVLTVGFRNARTRFLCLHAFLLSMLITCSIAILKFHGYLLEFNVSADQVFRNHIMTGFMVAYAAYLAVWLACKQGSRKNQGIYVCLSIIFTYHILFINSGRTGYLLYFLLMLLLVTQLGGSWKQAGVGIALIFAVFVASYSYSPQMKIGLNSVITEIQSYRHNEKNSSLGLRIQFHQFAHSLFNRHRLIGNGTASFPYYFKQENPVPAWAHRLWDPHSQYWLIAAEFGLLGLLLFGSLLYTLFTASCRLHVLRIPALGMLLPFIAGNFTDSLLFYSGSGYFFVCLCLCAWENNWIWNDPAQTSLPTKDDDESLYYSSHGGLRLLYQPGCYHG